MKSQKRGEIQTAAASTDKHKLWLIGGIALVVVLVLFGVFLSPAKEALFGKVIFTTVKIAPPVCIDLGEVNGVNYEWPSGFVEREFCTDIGCSVDPQGVCRGTRTSCPDVTQLAGYGNIAGSTYEQIRQRVCSSAGCLFRSGTTSPTTEQGDTCVPSKARAKLENSILGCTDNIDNDGDRYVDGRDTDCRNVGCAAGKVWVWSSKTQIGPTQLLDTSGRPIFPDWIDCCQSNQCVNINGPGCFDIDAVRDMQGGGGSQFICGNDNNWDICGDAPEVHNSADVSDGGGYVCQRISEDPLRYGWVPVS